MPSFMKTRLVCRRCGHSRFVTFQQKLTGNYNVFFLRCQQQPLEKQQPSCDKDAKHSDLSKYRTWSCDYLCPFHLQGRGKEASARALKHNNSGRRRRRHSGCYYNRLNPRVVLSPLKNRVRDGHFEILCSRRNLYFGSMKRKASPLPFRPMKKVKVTPDQEKKKTSRIRKQSEAKLTIDKFEPEKKKKGRQPKFSAGNSINDQLDLAKNKKSKSMGKGIDVGDCTSTVVNEFSKPSTSVNLFKTLKLKWSKMSNLRQENSSSSMINMDTFKGTPEQTTKTKYVRKKKPLLEEWKCKRIDDYLTKCDKISIIPTKLEATPECLSRDVSKSNESVVVQTLLDEMIDDIFTQTSDKNTDRNGATTFNQDFRGESVPVGNPDDRFQHCKTTAKVFDEISQTPKSSVGNLESNLNSPLFTNKSESRGKNIFSDNTSDETNVSINKTESSYGSYKASHQKSTHILEKIVLESNVPVMDCRNVSLEVFKKDMIHKTNFNYSSKGFFPRIKLSGHITPERSYCNHSKDSKQYKKTTNNDAQEKESVDKPNQERRHKISYKKFSSLKLLKKKNIGEENKVCMIDHYFSYLKKESNAQKIDEGSSCNSSVEENKNDLNSFSPSSPEKKPLVELQFSMLPFFSY